MLLARVNANGDTKDANVGALPGGFHDYLIKPVGDGYQFSVDGTVRATVAVTIPRGDGNENLLAESIRGCWSCARITIPAET
jgi:hypothetical protein